MLSATLGYALNDKMKLELIATNMTNRPKGTSNGALFHGEQRSVSAVLSYKF